MPTSLIRHKFKCVCIIDILLWFFLKEGRKGRDVWPSMVSHTWICALHLTHLSAHTQQWEVNTHTHTHTVNTHPEQWAVGSSGGSVPCSVLLLRVERALDIHSPHLQSLLDLRTQTRNLWVTSLALYPLGHDCPFLLISWSRFYFNCNFS